METIAHDGGGLARATGAAHRDAPTWEVDPRGFKFQRRWTVPSDPVCRIDLDEQNAIVSSEYHGKVFWFCTHTCKQAFDEDPERYLRDIAVAPPRRSLWKRIVLRARD